MSALPLLGINKVLYVFIPDNRRGAVNSQCLLKMKTFELEQNIPTLSV